ncbi:MAG: ABC transporter ATP-binding protein [Gammaproteobacteria bacterium]|nr:ABC transporter ATP-binding protein [Gammaproteobacteria bacterium]MBU0848303.1 ABC transporter ATP-binding protein [Gammaproteobacteria bacterium]MBU1266996.1 ABC transporter ATP-binding protein [Gammaproteobacteria bacterium]MBU1529563.1 ABC transporter ATP-binding protein [Gammaproteobacteria bacterium]MBU1781144.1 ABC transporter ATP-binding protein [Gammaproteobacteria bacterium]
MTSTVLQCENLVFKYASSGFELRMSGFCMKAGDTVFLEGDSGSGKSTLLNLMAGVLTPQTGHVALMGKNLNTLSPGQCDALRVNHVGFLFQQFNLLSYLSVLDNVTLPCKFSKRRKHNAVQAAGSVEQAAVQLLNALGMGNCLQQSVSTLSVGQQQRVAAARALIGKPDLIIADEPTSALDAGHQARFVELLLAQAAQQNTAVLLVSHDPELARYCARREHMNCWNAGATT